MSLPALTDTPAATPDLTRRTRALLVLDVVESVRLMEADEGGFVQFWQVLLAHTRAWLTAHGGRLVKSLGDGLMLEFDQPVQSVRAAFALHELCASANAPLEPEARRHLRIGLHVADFVADEQDIYGTGVNLAARIATLAGPGETVATGAVRDGLTCGLDAEVEDLGDCHLKHVERPVRAYRLGPPGQAPVIAPGSLVRLDLRPAVAVIPFAMRSAEPGHELLGEALADEVIAALSRTAEMHVISRLSTTAFRERQQSVDDIRTHLGANYILSGSCRSAGTQMALFVELVDARSGKIAWAESLRGQVQGLFVADDDLIARVVAGTSSAIMAREMERARSHALPTLEGYTLLLAAVAMMHRTSPAEFARAHAMLEHLIERSGRHPLPHAYLAHWWVMRVSQGWSDSPRRDAENALASTRRALDHDPQNSLALTIDGLVQTNLLKDPETASLRYEAALDANPNESLAWLLKGMMHAFRGEGDTAVDDTTRAISLSPLDPLRYYYDSLAASAAVSAGQYERAIALAQRSLRLNRTHTSTYRALAIAQSLAGDVGAARQTVGTLLRYEPHFSVTRFLQRSPSSRYAIGDRYAQALRDAGLPE